MKTRLKQFLQKALGFHRYLVLHSLFVVATMRFRSSEGDVMRFIERLEPDATVLDIGANVGAMSVLFSRRCPRGSVYAFEPILDNIRATKAVLGLFRTKNVALSEIALSDHSGELTMVMPCGEGVRSEGLCHVVGDESAVASGITYRVPVSTLDRVLPRGVRVSAIKIDVENHESAVLRGAIDTIARDRPLIYCELWSPLNKAQTFEMLEGLGYQAWVSVRGKLKRYTSQANSNFLFVPF